MGTWAQFKSRDFYKSDMNRADELMSRLNKISSRNKVEKQTQQELLDVFLNSKNSEHIDKVTETIKESREKQGNVNRVNVIDLSSTISFDSSWKIKKVENKEIYDKYNEIAQNSNLNDKEKNQEFEKLDRLLATKIVLLTEQKSILYSFKRRAYFTNEAMRDEVFAELSNHEPFIWNIEKKDYTLDGTMHYFIKWNKKNEITKNPLSKSKKEANLENSKINNININVDTIKLDFVINNFTEIQNKIQDFEIKQSLSILLWKLNSIQKEQWDILIKNIFSESDLNVIAILLAYLDQNFYNDKNKKNVFLSCVQILNKNLGIVNNNSETNVNNKSNAEVNLNLNIWSGWVVPSTIWNYVGGVMPYYQWGISVPLSTGNVNITNQNLVDIITQVLNNINTNNINNNINNNVDAKEKAQDVETIIKTVLEKFVEQMEKSFSEKWSSHKDELVKMYEGIKEHMSKEHREIIEKIINENTEIKEKIERLEKTQKDFSDKLERIEKNHWVIIDKLDDIKNSFEKELNDLKKRQEELHKEIKVLLAKIDWNIGDIQLEIKNIQKEIEELHKKMDELKKKLDECCEENVVPPIIPVTPDTYEDIATVSNITESYREEASRQAEERLRWRYKRTAWYKPWTRPDKLNLFLRRQHIKEKYERRFMTNLRWVQWDFESSAVADRHEIERQEDFNEAIEVALTDIDENNYPNTRRELDRLILRATWTHPDWIRDNTLSRARFQSELKTILESNLDPNRPATATDPNRRPLSDIYRMNDMDIIWTNIWEKVDNFRDHQILVRNIRDLVIRHRNDLTDDPFINNCRPLISAHISKHRVTPEFLKVNNIKLDDSNSMRQLKILESNNQILTNIAARTLKLKIQLLTRWEEAYNVEQEWGWATRIGEWLDRPYKEDGRLWRYFRRHPAMKEAFSWLWWWTKIAAVAVPAMFLAPFWPLAVASYVWTSTFAQVFFKKHAHYNKEHRWYQTRQATNLAMNTQERQRLNNVVWWMSRFRRNALYYFWLGKTARDVRQFRDYVQTTQNKLEDTNQVNASIENLINKNVLLNPEIINLEDRLAEWLARLDFHRETVRWWVSGQNFLWSNTQATSESEYQKLHRNILAGASRLWISLDDIRSYTRYNLVRTQIKEGTWQREWTEEIGYDIAVDRKKSRQKEKAVRWALKSWWISFGVSCLASTLFSKTVQNRHITTTSWERDPAIHDESLFVVWDVDAPLNTTLASNPHIAGMDAHITAWVDKLSYGNATRAAADMTAKQTATNTYIRTHFTWTNQTRLLNAINNPNLASVRSFAATGWADAWNQYLLATRYIEWVKELAEEMVATGHTATPLWSISFDIAWSTVEPSVAWSLGNQVARKMGVTLDYLIEKKVARWIWAPIPMNTFGEQLPRGWVNQNRRTRKTR